MIAPYGLRQRLPAATPPPKPAAMVLRTAIAKGGALRQISVVGAAQIHIVRQRGIEEAGVCLYSDRKTRQWVDEQKSPLWKTVLPLSSTLRYC
ncbi:MAG: hypothetical protein Q6K80_05030 [Thermostichus sp. DG_1_6_bins_120]